MTELSYPLDFSQLTVAERILLAQELWDSIHPQAESLPLTEAQKQEPDHRWRALEAGEMPTSTWAEVKQGLLRP